jgi:thioesterase domain-containing protein
MTISDLIEELKQKEIKVFFSGGKLKYSGPEENITPELIESLKKYKGKLIKYFWPEEFSLIMPINTGGTKIPLFIVHGDYANYVISEHLGPDQPVYGFFHPGSEGEAIRFKSVKEMAETYLDKVMAVYPSGPFYLLGFSFGGMLAFEMAVQLQKKGYEVPFLVLIDSISPFAKEPIELNANLFKKIRINYLRPPRRKLKQFIKLNILNSYILINKPIPVNKRADYIYLKYLKLKRRYAPAKFEGDILLFRSTKNLFSEKYLGWETLVNGIKLINIDGKHLEIFTGKSRTEKLQTEIEKYLAYVNGLK